MDRITVATPAPTSSIASPHRTKSTPSPTPASNGSTIRRRPVPRRRSNHTSTSRTGSEIRQRQNALVLPVVPDTLMNTDDKAMQKLPAAARSAGWTRVGAGCATAGRASVVVTVVSLARATVKDKRMFVSGTR